MTFTPEVYAIVRDGAIRSAQIVVPIVADLVKPRTVVDVGGGEGWWARTFFEQGGVDVLMGDESVPVLGGIDELSPVGRSYWTRHVDLTDPPFLRRTYDLALCLEVAEHVEERHAAKLVDWLCGLAPVVLFSAAIPDQGGHGHVNEQWPTYWAALFAANGYLFSEDLRWRLWDNEDVEPWYRQNVMLAASAERLTRMGLTATSQPKRVVHPRFYESRVAERDAHHRGGNRGT